MVVELFLAAAVGSSAAANAPHVPSVGAKNLLLITLDTTRADHLGAWGWTHARTPRLDALAAAGTRFVRCDTAATVTLPAHASILTGLLPWRHGVRDNGRFALAAHHVTLAELLEGHGFATAAVVGAEVLARRFGLDQGFASYDDDFAGGAEGSSGAGFERDAHEVTDAAINHLDALRSPFFLWAHYFDPHAEYRAPPRFRDVASGPSADYDAEISFMDEEIGRLLDHLQANVREQTLIIVVGDHGEMLGEHGELEHGILPYSGARRVPLIIAGPGAAAAAVSSQLTSTVDIFPTVLDLLNIPEQPEVDGRSMTPTIESPEASFAGFSYCESMYPYYAYGWHPLRALSDGRWLYVAGAHEELHDLRRPDGESVDVAPSRRIELQRWRRRLVQLSTDMGVPLELDPPPPSMTTDRTMLEALGYVDAEKSRATQLRDPRQMLEIRRHIRDLTREIGSGHCKPALEQLHQLLDADPGNPRLESLLAGCELQLGQVEAARARYAALVSSEPGVAEYWLGLAQCRQRLGDAQEAATALRKALELDPAQREAAVLLARWFRESTQPAAALKVLDSLLKHVHGNAAVFRERGLCHIATGNAANALEDFHTAHRLAPTSAEILEPLAALEYSQQRYREAATSYRQLLRLAPHRADIWKTLGAINLYKLDEPDAALRCFRSALAHENDPKQRATLSELIRALEKN